MSKHYTLADLEVSTWFERGRACVELRVSDTQETIFEAWDESVHELVDDGFLDPRNWKQSMYEYAQHLDLIH